MSSQRKCPHPFDCQTPQVQWLPVLQPHKSAAVSASAGAVMLSHGRPVQKPRLASPANVSKRGLSARPYASQQTPIVVNVRLPKRILAAAIQGRITEELTKLLFPGRQTKKPPV